MHRILFVCLGNICRSPAAEGAFLHLIKAKNEEALFEIDSAGTGAWHAGEKADQRMRAAAKSRGIELPSVARQVNSERDFDYFDLIVAMDDQNFKDLSDLCSNEENLKKIVRMTDYKIETSAEYVPDPYYGGPKGFEEVLDIVMDCSKGLRNSLNVIK
jgi:protein-tyrosine phosphatase